MESVVLRPAGLPDATMLAQIQRDAELAAFSHIFPPDRYPYPFEAVVTEWDQALADAQAQVITAESAGRIIGVVATNPGHLRSLYVSPPHWGTGIARLLHDTAIDTENNTGQWQLWVLKNNNRARRFYERQGWHADGRTKPLDYPPHPTLLGYQLTVTDRAST
ncbi:GNAT family N-acetyltransferase [Nocardia sp. NPDC050175]|uniref:GNAT family N-acetyltransferase n=1 Tax=Nocardia sp. NPDC050175 TaxID=3364317 RepID=UPI0037BC1BF4